MRLILSEFFQASGLNWALDIIFLTDSMPGGYSLARFSDNRIEDFYGLIFDPKKTHIAISGETIVSASDTNVRICIVAGRKQISPASARIGNRSSTLSTTTMPADAASARDLSEGDRFLDLNIAHPAGSRHQVEPRMAVRVSGIGGSKAYAVQLGYPPLSCQFQAPAMATYLLVGDAVTPVTPLRGLCADRYGCGPFHHFSGRWHPV